METFIVVVRNELTDEVRTVVVRSAYYVDAQVEALHTVFRLHGWRKVVADTPQVAIDARAS